MVESKLKLKKRENLVARSVEFYNPSPYWGTFIRKINPLTYYNYTQTPNTFALNNQGYVTKKYDLKQPVLGNVIAAPWNIPTVYPLRNRRYTLI